MADLYPPRLIPRGMLERSREMRKQATEFESKLWRELRNRQLGYKFCRQFWIDKYFADFCCLERRLIVEVDGAQHLERKKYDEQRTLDLQKQKFRVIRFWNYEVEDIEYVLDTIYSALEEKRGKPAENPTPSPACHDTCEKSASIAPRRPLP